MRKAILHLGFHKTGTTFLQFATRRWIKLLPDDTVPVFYSSQHMPESGWLRLRSEHGLRLRHRLAHASLQAPPRDESGVRSQLTALDLTSEFEALRTFFDRPQPILIHSDENSIGDTFGHPGYGRGAVWPFYPNGEWLCAVYSAAALASHDEVHLVLSLRRFDEMVVSSMKNAVRSPKPFPPLELFSRALKDVGSRCRMLLERVSEVDYIHKVHVFDYELLKRSPGDYFRAFSRLAGNEFALAPRQMRKIINPSQSDNATLDRLVERGVLAGSSRADFSDIPSLIGGDFLGTLAKEYAALTKDLLMASSTGGKIHYYC